jgi:hypothetical protein
LGPEERHYVLAPWLYGVEVSVLQSLETPNVDQTIAATGLPLALINTATGRKQVRRFLYIEDEIPDELSTASFMDLAPGVYRVELLSPHDPLPDRHINPSGGPKDSFFRSIWRRVSASLSRRQLDPPDNQPSPYPQSMTRAITQAA